MLAFFWVTSITWMPARRSALGYENPRSMVPLMTLNIVVTPPMPRARTKTARRQKDFSLMRTRSPMRTSWRKPERNMGGSDEGLVTSDERAAQRVEHAPDVVEERKHGCG